MIKTIYRRAFAVCMKKPFKFWGISLLAGLFSGLITAFFGIIPGVAICLQLLLSVGTTMVYLHGYRGEEVETLQLFDAFKDGATAKRTLGGMGWMFLWIFVWGLIPVVGPIFAMIRTYEYRLTPYILVQEPDIRPTDAIKVSKERMNGWKAKMFLAELLPVLILLAVLLVLGLLGLIPFVGILFRLLLILFFIACALLLPFFLGLVEAAFYEEITNPTPAAELITENTEKKYCPVCGAKISKKAIFCPQCGKRISGEQQAETTGETKAEETEAEETETEEVKAEESEETKTE